ncbi:MAG: hypothetical protein MJ252_15975 [archaeon]|nr:hypothetical protein [archaeon]
MKKEDIPELSFVKIKKNDKKNQLIKEESEKEEEVPDLPFVKVKHKNSSKKNINQFHENTPKQKSKYKEIEDNLKIEDIKEKDLRKGNEDINNIKDEIHNRPRQANHKESHSEDNKGKPIQRRNTLDYEFDAELFFREKYRMLETLEDLE